MLPNARFTSRDYERMAKELESLAQTIRQHPEMDHHTAERLAIMASEMRQDARTEYLKTGLRPTPADPEI